MTSGLDAALGGPLGRRARPGGPWFRPGPFAYWLATLSWVVLMVRQEPCLNDPGQQYKQQCYTDVLALWGARGIADARVPYLEADLEYPVLTGGFIHLTRWLSGWLPAGRPEHAFFGVTAVALFACFLGLVWVHLRLAPRWSALLVAGSPLVMASGLINWDLLAVLLASGALLAWARGRPGWAGVLVGLATATKLYPVLFCVPIAVLCLRAGRPRAALTAGLAALGAWLAVNLPVYLLAPDGWWHFWVFNADRGAEFGSLWHVWTGVGGELPGLSVVVTVVFLTGLGGLVALFWRAPCRPRLAQAVLLVVLLFVLVNKVYSPQHMLWLLPLVVLARPVWVDQVVFTAGELVYYVAIWMYLDGALFSGDGQPRLYWLAIGVRVACQLFVGVRVVRDIVRPGRDPVRVGCTDDPGGGVLDGVPDRYAAPVARRAR